MNKNDQKSLIDTFKSYPFRFEKLSLNIIETDPNQPRKLFELRNGGDPTRLLKSIQHYGIEEPIKVSEVSVGRYIIMDGHRRFDCARELGFKTVPCRIYPKMNDGEFEARRYEMQNNRRSWRPIEKANAINRIKTEYSDASPKEIGDLIGITQKTLFHFDELRNTRMDYLGLMSAHNLKEYQCVDFLKVLPKLRKIKQFQTDDIVKIIFRKISNNLLYRATDFTALRKIFSMVWAMMHKISAAMGERDSRYNLSGIIELDEGFFSTEVSDIDSDDSTSYTNLSKLVAEHRPKVIPKE